MANANAIVDYNVAGEKAHIIVAEGFDSYFLNELMKLKNELYSTDEIDEKRLYQLCSLLSEKILSKETKKFAQGIINDIENYLS